ELLRQPEGMLWVATSGSSGVPKLIGHQKSEFLAAARCLGEDFLFKPNERWLKALPLFHVGGLAIYARAQVHQQEVLEFNFWSPADFHSTLLRELIHWTSLVPTQIYDLV